MTWSGARCWISPHSGQMSQDIVDTTLIGGGSCPRSLATSSMPSSWSTAARANWPAATQALRRWCDGMRGRPGARVSAAARRRSGGRLSRGGRQGSSRQGGSVLAGAAAWAADQVDRFNRGWTPNHHCGEKEMNEKLIFNCTWGREDPERATLPFVAANIAATAGQDAVVLCTIEAVRLGTKGGTDGVEAAGLPKLCDLLNQFVANNGKVWLCGACTKPRGITEEQLAAGMTIVGAAKVVEEIVTGANAGAFA